MPRASSSDTAKLYEKCLSDLKEVQRDKSKLKISEIQELRKKFKQTCDSQKRGTQILDQKINSKRKAGTTRSGTIRGAAKQSTYASGKWVNKGIDDSQEPFEADEVQYLKKAVNKFKKVNDLKLEHIKYLVMDVHLEELKKIRSGEKKTYFHKRYRDLVDQGRTTTELHSEICLSLFTNEQRDYINGLLQGAFDTTTKDAKGDIKHNDINYVNIVMVAEITARIVKQVHKLRSTDEAFAFMKESAKEALGLGGDDDDS